MSANDRVALDADVVADTANLRRRRELARRLFPDPLRAQEHDDDWETIVAVRCARGHKLAEVLRLSSHARSRRHERLVRHGREGMPARWHAPPLLVVSWCRLVSRIPHDAGDPPAGAPPYRLRRENAEILDVLDNPTAHSGDPTALVASCACGEQRVNAPELRRLAEREDSGTETKQRKRKLVWTGGSLRASGRAQR